MSPTLRTPRRGRPGCSRSSGPPLSSAPWRPPPGRPARPPHWPRQSGSTARRRGASSPRSSSERLVTHDQETGTYSLGFGLIDLAGQAGGDALVRSARARAAAPGRPGAGDRRPGRRARRRADLRRRGDGRHRGGGRLAGPAGRAARHVDGQGPAGLLRIPPSSAMLLRLPRGGRLPRYTPSTITSLTTLEKELALIRERGYAVCRGEFESSAWGVSAPVLDLAERPVAVVSVWGPSERLTERPVRGPRRPRHRGRGGDRRGDRPRRDYADRPPGKVSAWFSHMTPSCRCTPRSSLVNSAEPPDTLTSQAELEEFWTRFGYTGRHDRDEAELAAVRRLRPRLRELLTAERDQAVAIVNDLLERAGATPQARAARRPGLAPARRGPRERRWPSGSPPRLRWR